MAHLSPSTVAINTIAHCLANAIDAAAGLDASVSEDLRALLRIAASEAGRVRKANRKAAAAAKRTAESQSEKKATSKRKNQAEVQPAEKPKSRRRKAEAVNGVALQQ